MGPPKPRFSLTVGVTGHRLNRLDAARLEALKPIIDSVLSDVRAEALRVGRAADFSTEPPVVRLLSAMAEGADRVVARAALALDFELEAALPFARDIYLLDFETDASRADFEALLARASRVLEMPGERSASAEAYDMVGRVLLAHSDILLALWDGDAANGMGGTGAVVADAVRLGVPVLHIHTVGDGKPELIWLQAHGASASDIAPRFWQRMPATAEAIAAVVQSLCAPPNQADEAAQWMHFTQEQEFRWSGRVEYPAMLAAIGVSKFSAAHVRRPAYAEATRAHWAPFQSQSLGLIAANQTPLKRLEAAYSWCDNLASHYAQVFRSGHVLNFSFAALAVMAALLGLVFPSNKIALVTLELVLIGVVVWNTRHGLAREWHRRWLDYRSIAERLRPMRSLKLLGAATLAGDRRTRRDLRRWIDWYVQMQWREFGLPHGRLDRQTMAHVRSLLIDEELSPQIAYHQHNAHRMHQVDHRLHVIGLVMFIATIAICVGFLALSFINHDWAMAQAKLFTVATAILPALGSAVYGIRVHSDFAAHGHRSQDSSAVLHALRAQTPAILSSETLAATVAIAETAAQTMWADLADWRLTAQQRNLDIPG